MHRFVFAVNSDGTLSRIANWHRLSEHEQEVAIKRLAKRNAQRLAELQATHSTGSSAAVASAAPAAREESGSSAPACGGAGSAESASLAAREEPSAPTAAMTLDGGGGVRIGLLPDAAAAVAAVAAEKAAERAAAEAVVPSAVVGPAAP